MIRLLFFFAMAAVFWFGAASTSQACKYCEMAAMPDAYNSGSDTYSGGFPLDRAIDKFKPAAPAAPMNVITSAAELPKPVLKPAIASLVVAVPVQPVVKIVQSAQPAVLVKSDSPGSLPKHLLDGSLMGLAAAGGVFFWRTRRS